MKKETEANAVTNSKEYSNMVDLLAVYSESSAQMTALQAECDQEMLDALDERRAHYSKLQETMTKTETALEVIALAHPEWFQTRQSLKTPYGTVKFKRDSKLVAANEEASIILLEQHAKDAPGAFNAEAFIRTKKSLNLEALEDLSDEMLKAFRIKRVPTQNFSVVPAKVDMGKAVKEAAEAT